MAYIKNTHAPPIEDRATEMGKTGSEAVSAAAPMTAIAEGSLQEPSQSEATFAEVAAASTSDYVHTGAKEVSSAETLDKSLPKPSQAFATETRPVQIAAAVSADDVVHGDFSGVLSARIIAQLLPRGRAWNAG